ncbi:tRNA (adenosine(37)-N6)-threonylcarbamoyltransferase complex dimerization subunit type 1 TsaB [Leptospira sp. WS60.C2]
MNFLYFDTTQDWIHVLVGSFETGSTSEVKILSKRMEESPKEASYRLVEMIRTALNESNVLKPDLIIVPNGPGSFTGIRITVTTARDLSQLWEIPVIGFDSTLLYLVGMFDTIASLKTNQNSAIICLDGKQGKYYTKYFDGVQFSETKDQSPDDIIESLKSFTETPNKWYYTGSIPHFYPHHAVKIEATNLNLSSIMQYSLEQINPTELKEYNYLSLLPNYIRGTYVDQK